MNHDVSLISTIATGFGLALIFGFIATRLRMPPLVGYLMAGVVIGPTTPGFVADIHLASQLAEIGVMLLMFGVGLHFSLSDLMAVRRIAIPGAIVQIVVAVALAMGTAHLWGWPVGAALVYGLCLSVASTVVLLKALESKGLIDSVNGRIAVGWLVVEDLVMVLVLVLLPAFASMLAPSSADVHGAASQLGPQAASQAASQAAMAASAMSANIVAQSTPQPLWFTIVLTLAKVTAFIATMLVVGRRVFPKMLWWVASSGSRELFTLCVVAAAVGVAFGAAKLFDVSFALGAFFAGMMMQESEFSQRAAEESLPLRDAFSVLFFVSVGMLFDPSVLWLSPGKLAATIAIVLVGKTLAAMALVLLFRYPLNTALTVGVSLAQIGEFSFILAGLGSTLGLLPKEGRDLILAGALVSIAANSALFGVMEPVLNWVRAHSELARRLEARDDPLAQLPTTVDPAKLAGQVVLVGYGEIGQQVAARLQADHVPFVVADESRDTVERLRRDHVPAVAGDLFDPATLIQAHIAKAAVLIITLADSLLIRQLVDITRQLNPATRIMVHGASEEEASLLRQDLDVAVFSPEGELAYGMARHVLAWMRPSAASPSASTDSAPHHH